MMNKNKNVLKLSHTPPLIKQKLISSPPHIMTILGISPPPPLKKSPPIDSLIPSLLVGFLPPVQTSLQMTLLFQCQYLYLNSNNSPLLFQFAKRNEKVMPPLSLVVIFSYAPPSNFPNPPPPLQVIIAVLKQEEIVVGCP